MGLAMRHLSESFLARRIQLYGYLIAGIYAASFFAAYLSGRWLLDCTGTPLLLDFTAFWIGGVQALHGTTGLLYGFTIRPPSLNCKRQ